MVWSIVNDLTPAPGSADQLAHSRFTSGILVVEVAVRNERPVLARFGHGAPTVGGEGVAGKVAMPVASGADACRRDLEFRGDCCKVAAVMFVAPTAFISL